MDIAVRDTKGKMIKPNEMHRLINMTRILYAGSDVASEVRFMRPQFTRDIVKEKVAQRSNFDSHENCIDLVFELADPRADRGFYTETNCRTLSLGDRVRRWIVGNQDSELPGTVIGQRDSRNVFVEWDSGYINFYMFDESVERYNIMKISDYRKTYDNTVDVGCRVERGNNWKYDDEDGGRGCQGTVLNVKDNRTAVVRWDCRKTALYKIGKNGVMEIQLCKFSSVGKRNTINPDVVNEDDIKQSNNRMERSPDTVNEEEMGNNGGNQEDVQIYGYIIPAKSNTDVKYLWEYKDDGEWKQFSSDLNIRLEKFYSRNPNGRPLLEIDSVSYIINFRRMKKIHPSTRQDIDIQRRLSDSSLECKR